MERKDMKLKMVVFTAYYPPFIGGLSSHAHEFNCHLSEKNVDITVFTARLPDKTKEYEIINDNLRIIRFPAFEIIPNYPLPQFWRPRFWQLYLSLFTKKYDLIISRIRFFSTTLLALILAKMKGVKWIHIEHTSNFTILTSRIKSIVAKWYDLIVGRLIFKSANLNVSISQAVSRFVLKFDKRESPIIYRGLDLEELDSIEPDSQIKEQYSDKIIILTAARLYKWKGVGYSIAAIKSLPKDIKKQVVFLIAGDGEDYAELKRSCDQSIVMLGSMPREKVIGIMKVADMYIHSSMPGGGLSTSLLEAMYCQCAIIATPNEGADEVIEHTKNGLMVSNPYANNISESIQWLLEDEVVINNLKTEAKKTIQRRFCWMASIEKYLDAFNKLS